MGGVQARGRNQGRRRRMREKEKGGGGLCLRESERKRIGEVRKDGRKRERKKDSERKQGMKLHDSFEFEQDSAERTT